LTERCVSRHQVKEEVTVKGRYLRGFAALATSLVVLPGAAQPAWAASRSGTLLSAPPGQAIRNSYIVVLKPGKAARPGVDALARTLSTGQGGTVGHVYTSALQGFEVTLDEAAARRLAANPAVDYVQQNSVMRLQDTQPVPPNFGLDRIDEPDWPLDGQYTYPTTADGIRVYVIDSGIRASHVDFGGRVQPGVDVIFGGSTDDCSGHGTHVAGIVGGRVFGVAKGVSLVPVKVFTCAGLTDTASVTAGIDWVTAHHNPGERAIANMSISADGASSVVSLALERSMADGIVYVVAAGNYSADACAFSPGNMTNAVTVGATQNAGNDSRSEYSNHGACVDVFAPGDGINSASSEFDTAARVRSGTSQATAFASGVAALIWSVYPSRTAAEITSDVSRVALHGVIPNYGLQPNRMLFLPRIIISPLPELFSLPGRAVSRQLSAAGGIAPYTWSATGLPDRVTINPTTGVISGQLPGKSTWTVTVTATDATGTTGRATATWRIDSWLISISH
jgi:subtilisin family serine protease